ncbi:hypothetical protein EYZ11_011081 [Aspergillus tanneri]|uniref:Uncharacterized protein n=1 Tax=Aspergillus tanneri TaxID=1220188 RepID=A0A4S3J3P2_9EURO|nr:hypothetical protein EYZ11_011081 [Aspergillus tanneri]
MPSDIHSFFFKITILVNY